MTYKQFNKLIELSDVIYSFKNNMLLEFTVDLFVLSLRMLKSTETSKIKRFFFLQQIGQAPKWKHVLDYLQHAFSNAVFPFWVGELCFKFD